MPKSAADRVLGLERYDIKILMVLLKCVEGRKDCFHWLVDNGYPELAAFSNALRSDTEALVWLSKHNFRWLALLECAIEGHEAARIWVAKNINVANLMFAIACRDDYTAQLWLKKNKLDYFLLLASKVSETIKMVDAEQAGPYVWHNR